MGQIRLREGGVPLDGRRRHGRPGDLDGGTFESSALDASADGSVVVGYGSSDAGMEAFIWDADNGLRSLREVLVNDFGLGASLSDWRLNVAKAVSDDGRVITGTGLRPNGNAAWVVVIPKPPAHAPQPGPDHDDDTTSLPLGPVPTKVLPR